MFGSSFPKSTHRIAAGLFCVCTFAAGCQSPYYADRGAGLGALAGAGAGAIIGNQTGDAGTGAVIGAGLGALTGSVVGNGMDEMAAQNRAQIAAQMGRQVQVGAASVNEVVSMTKAGVDPRLIQNYIQTSGVERPLTPDDLIYLSNNGVSSNVIQTMQNPPIQAAPVVAGRPPVIVEEHYYGPPGCYGPQYGFHHGFYRGRSPHASFGITLAK